MDASVGVSLPGQVAAVEALKCPDYYRERYKETHLLREDLATALRTLPGLRVFSSQANFILVEFSSECADEISERLRMKRIYVRNCRDMSDRFGNRFIRIAVKNASQNESVVRAISAAVLDPELKRLQ